MPTLDVTLSVPVVDSPRLRQLRGLFDLPPAAKSTRTWSAHLPIDERPWRIGLIVGPSGCGKSTLARRLLGDRLVAGFDWPADRSFVEGFPDAAPIAQVTGLLTAVGFASPPAWLRPFRCLSNGEQFRATVARALCQHPDLVGIDEFTSVVDRTVARIGATAVAKAVRRGRGKFVAVGCHYDVVDWLDPDWIYEPDGDRFHWRRERLPLAAPPQHPPVALEVRTCSYREWPRFAPHHYLSGNCIRAARCFGAWIPEDLAAGPCNRFVGFCAVISTPSKTCHFWREHRVVVLPDYQGLGLGNRLSEFCGSIFAADKKYFCTTSNPAMIAHRSRSPLWRVSRRGTYVPKRSAPTVAGRHIFQSTSRLRLTASFQYVGPTRPDLAALLQLPSFRKPS
jgi:hypothetical protein